MRRAGRVAACAVILLVALGALATEPPDSGGRPGLRLLSARVFWMDSGEEPPEDTAAPSEAHGPSGPGLFAAGRQLRDPVTAIGTLTRGPIGAVRTLDLAGAASLPGPTGEAVRDLIDLRVMERQAFWEAAFELEGLRRDEIEWVEALGPGLIKPTRRWVNVLRGALETPGQPPGHDACLGLGPFHLCLDMPRMFESVKAAHPRERSRIRLTQSLWHAGESCGVVVVGRLLDYSVVTFRVRTNGKGALPEGVRHLPPFDLAKMRSWARPGGRQTPEPVEGPLPLPRAGADRPPEHYLVGRLPDAPVTRGALGGAPRLAGPSCDALCEDGRLPGPRERWRRGTDGPFWFAPGAVAPSSGWLERGSPDR